MLEPPNSFLVAILGPTGSGKSALALALARIFNGEIVNFDSVQVYRGCDIGSAKTLTAQRNGIPHHLLDILSPADDLNSGEYGRLARICLKEIADRNSLPILVGGTGFYLRSLLDGLSPAPGRNPDLRRRLEQLALRRPTALHRFLRQADPVAARRIHANDHQKLIRAIEIAQAAAPPAALLPLTGFAVTRIGLNPPRPDLYRRINQRSAAMFETGLLNETQALLDAGIPATSKALNSLGYRQALAVLENRLTLPEAILDLQTKTRQYAKRQMTWFRREPDVHWLNGFGEQPEILESARRLISAAHT